MKHILKIIIITSFFACKAQQIVHLNGKDSDYPNGAYFKDLSNHIDPFVGTWLLSSPQETLEIELIKQEQVPYFNQYYQDMLVGEYRYSNGQVFINFLPRLLDISLKGNDHYIAGNYMVSGASNECSQCDLNDIRFLLNFRDPQRDYLDARVYVELIENTNPQQLKVIVKAVGGGMIPNQNSPTENRVPYGTYILTKQ